MSSIDAPTAPQLTTAQTMAEESPEREKEMLTTYRALMTKADPTREDIAALLELQTRFQLDNVITASHQRAISRALELHSSVAGVIKRWREIEVELGEVQVGQLQLRVPTERAAAHERQMRLEDEQVALARSVASATAEVGQLRTDNPRVCHAIEPIPKDTLPNCVQKSSPILCALLGAAVLLEGSDADKAKFLRFRGRKMNMASGWDDPISGTVPLSTAFKRQISQDLAAARKLLPLLAIESSYH